ncbi:TPA: hypothetical protein QCY29_005256 [Bacillus toyonensis]|nr:hypothetical protein [Bacillus toyonensis]
MDAHGWVKLHRKTKCSEVFNDVYLYRLWSLLLIKATYKDRDVEYNGHILQLKAGQLITGRQSLSDEFNEQLPPKQKTPKSTVWSWLKKLEKLGNISIESNTMYSIVTIEKWKEYQFEEEQEEKEPPKPKGQKKEAPPAPKKQGEDKDMSDFLQAGEAVGKDPSKIKEQKNKGKREYKKDDVEFKLAGRLFYWILKNNDNAKKPDPQKWSNTIRLMIERDNRDPQMIACVIDWCQNDDFWHTNILSADKLRKQFDQLFMKMQADKKKQEKIKQGQNRVIGSRAERKNDLLRDLMQQEEDQEYGSEIGHKVVLPIN